MILAVGAAIGMSACAGNPSKPIDRSPLSTAYTPPFICNYVPKATVEQMTGVRDPLVTGSLNLAVKDRPAIGACSIFESSGDRHAVLRIMLDTAGSRGQIDEQLQDGSKPLPSIVPDGFGYYVKDANIETRVGSVLVRGKVRLGIELVRGVKGRDNEADVVALMRLIAPKLILGTGTPPPVTKD
jgi:hypothetical protein